MSMNPISPPTELRREPMRWQMKLCLSLFVVAGLFLLWAWLEHERAKAGLVAYKRQLAARDERLDFKDHIPQMPKPEENAAPDLLAAIAGLPDMAWEQRSGAMTLTTVGRARVSWQQSELPNSMHPDVWPWVLASVEDHRPALLVAAKALERPRWGVALDYQRLGKISLHHVGLLRRLAGLQADAVVADLHMDRPAEAYAHLRALTRLMQRVEEPIALTQLVRPGQAQLAATATWEALQKPGWTDAQLAELQATWEATEVWRPHLAAQELERAFIANWFDEYRADPEAFQQLAHGARSGGAAPLPPSSLWKELSGELFHDPAKAAEIAKHLWRAGVWLSWTSYRDERHLYEKLQPWLEFDREAIRAPNAFPAAARFAAAQKSTPETPEGFFVARDWRPDLYRIRVMGFESVRRLTITALALERRRLRHGSYPGSLAGLVPEFLREVPIDFMDAKQLRYRRESDGTFSLWSVGENGTDDGGEVAVSAGVAASRSINWLRASDLVWPRVASEAEVSALHTRYGTERAAKPAP